MARKARPRQVRHQQALIIFALVGCLYILALFRADGPFRPGHPPQTGETRLRVYLTGYSYWDNTPPGSAIIARPVLHREAGGTGTFKDPVTLAVGHRKVGDTFIPDYPPGTRFYLPRLRKYAMVEDLCGDGDTPQLGPCHIGYQGHSWVDIYVGGIGHDAKIADACTRMITGIQPAILNPRPDYPSEAGEVLSTNCATGPELSPLPVARPDTIARQNLLWMPRRR